VWKVWTAELYRRCVMSCKLDKVCMATGRTLCREGSRVFWRFLLCRCLNQPPNSLEGTRAGMTNREYSDAPMQADAQTRVYSAKVTRRFVDCYIKPSSRFSSTTNQSIEQPHLRSLSHIKFYALRPQSRPRSSCLRSPQGRVR